MAEYCPHHATCPFYKNWVEKRKNKRTDVIISEGEGRGFRYDCLTLNALEDPVTEGGITMTDDLKNRVSNPEQRRFDCSHLVLLNGIIDLGNKLSGLLSK